MANSPGFVVSTSQGNVKLWSPFICAPGDPGKATLDTSARRGGPAWKILRHELIPLCMLTALTFPEVRSLGDQSPAKNVNSGTCTTTVGYPPRALALASDPTSCEAKVTGQVRPMNSKALLHAPSSPNPDGSPDLNILIKSDEGLALPALGRVFEMRTRQLLWRGRNSRPLRTHTDTIISSETPPPPMRQNVVSTFARTDQHRQTNGPGLVSAVTTTVGPSDIRQLILCSPFTPLANCRPSPCVSVGREHGTRYEHSNFTQR